MVDWLNTCRREWHCPKPDQMGQMTCRVVVRLKPKLDAVDDAVQCVDSAQVRVCGAVVPPCKKT